jgi:hypothetical protein
MSPATSSGAIASAAALCALAAALAGCAASADASSRAASSPASTLRVLVKLARPGDDPGAIAAEAARIAGVPVSYAAATSASWHALAVHCGDAAACDAAIGRLRSAGSIYQAVEIDGRKQRAPS